MTRPTEAEILEQQRSEDELIEIARAADYARDLLNNGVLREYRGEVREQLIEAITNCSDRDDIGRFRLSQCLTTFDRFWSFVEDRVAEGDLASKQLDELRRGGSRMFF